MKRALYRTCLLSLARVLLAFSPSTCYAGYCLTSLGQVLPPAIESNKLFHCFFFPSFYRRSTTFQSENLTIIKDTAECGVHMTPDAAKRATMGSVTTDLILELTKIKIMIILNKKNHNKVLLYSSSPPLLVAVFCL